MWHGVYILDFTLEVYLLIIKDIEVDLGISVLIPQGLLG